VCIEYEDIKGLKIMICYWRKSGDVHPDNNIEDNVHVADPVREFLLVLEEKGVGQDLLFTEHSSASCRQL